MKNFILHPSSFILEFFTHPSRSERGNIELPGVGCAEVSCGKGEKVRRKVGQTKKSGENSSEFSPDINKSWLINC